MKRTRVKICGITRFEDAEVAIEAGADALGFVFYEASPRHITIDKAKNIIEKLPPFVTTVGLFVNPAIEYVTSVLQQVSLGCLQFHGEETPAFCRQFSRPYIKAIRIQEQTPIMAEMLRYPDAQGMLLDTYHATIAGGTGQTFNWSLIPQPLPVSTILAGGLTVENVSEAIRMVGPYAVDVSGGVEASKGIKDHVKIRAFIREVRQLDCR